MDKNMKDMNKLREMIINRRKAKINEFNRAKSYFKTSCDMEIDMGCFETNAISSLVHLKALKAEISELYEIEKLVSCILNQNEGE